MNKVLTLYQTSTGKKFIMAITGFIGFGFVVMHMLGNLQIFLGPEKLNNYAVLLRSTGGLLWVARFTLLGAVIMHVVAATQLTSLNERARPVGYHKWQPLGSDYASRTMVMSGPILLAFIIFHLLDITFGTVTPGFREGDVYGNVLASFSRWYISLFYIVAMVSLGFHMYHGLWSMFQSLGANNSRYNRMLRIFAIVMTLIVVIGNISIPVAVLTGILKK